MTRAPTILLGCLLALAGCAAPTTADKDLSGTWVPGKGDGSFEIREAGPLPLGGSRTVAVDGALSAYRVESYGGTTLTVDLVGQGETDAFLVVEGPLDGFGDAVAPGSGAVLAQDDDSGDGVDARLTVTLEQPGVYRVLAGTYESLGKGDEPYGGVMELSAACTAACARRAIPARLFLEGLRAEGKLEGLMTLADRELGKLVPHEETRALLLAQLRVIADSSSFEGVERFPVIPLRQIGASRSAMGLIPASEPNPGQVVEGTLAALLGPCTAGRHLPSPINAALPEVGYGHFPNVALSPCQATHSERLAQILTSLAADNGSSVEYGGRTLRTPAELVDALVASGHRVEVRNERTYANFISLTYGDADVVWPAWLDTGVDVDGERLMVPMGHSHHAWRIEGPDVDARVMFYLGISGAAFFGQTSVRPVWTGDVVSDGSSSEDSRGRDHVLSTLDAASVYLRRIRTERTTVAAGLPADGYGFLGVCNDSNAVIEYVTRGTVTAFPLLRAAELDATSLSDGLDDALRALPKDGDVAPDRADALARILAMTPHDLDSPFVVDERLRDQLRGARDALANRR